MNTKLLKAAAKLSAKNDVRNLDRVVVSSGEIISTDSYRAILAQDYPKSEEYAGIPDGHYLRKDIISGIIKAQKETHYPDVKVLFDKEFEKERNFVLVNAKLLREVLLAVESIEKEYGNNMLIEMSAEDGLPVLIKTDHCKSMLVQCYR